MGSIALFTHSLQILAFNTESHALICPNKMDSLKENIVTIPHNSFKILLQQNSRSSTR
jgi:hypothetical protein